MFKKQEEIFLVKKGLIRMLLCKKIEKTLILK